MKRILLTLAFAAAVFAAGNAYAGDISFNVGKMYTTRKAGEAVVADAGTYVVVPITMKNLTNQEQSVGGIGHTSFELRCSSKQRRLGKPQEILIAAGHYSDGGATGAPCRRLAGE
jgi:hypothetical protein